MGKRDIECEDIRKEIEFFMESVASKKISVDEDDSSPDCYIYNEFSFQHELGIYLREKYQGKYIIKFEKKTKANSCKSEIDIYITDLKGNGVYAIELKFLKNSEIPDRMFGCLEDMKFMYDVLTQEEKMKKTFCVVIAKTPCFYEGDIPKTIRKELIDAYRELEKKEENEQLKKFLKNYDNYYNVYYYFRAKEEQKNKKYIDQRKSLDIVYGQTKGKLRLLDTKACMNTISKSIPIEWKTLIKGEKPKYYIIELKK